MSVMALLLEVTKQCVCLTQIAKRFSSSTSPLVSLMEITVSWATDGEAAFNAKDAPPESKLWKAISVTLAVEASTVSSNTSVAVSSPVAMEMLKRMSCGGIVSLNQLSATFTTVSIPLSAMSVAAPEPSLIYVLLVPVAIVACFFSWFNASVDTSNVTVRAFLATYLPPPRATGVPEAELAELCTCILPMSTDEPSSVSEKLSSTWFDVRFRANDTSVGRVLSAVKTFALKLAFFCTALTSTPLWSETRAALKYTWVFPAEVHSFNSDFKASTSSFKSFTAIDVESSRAAVLSPLSWCDTVPTVDDPDWRTSCDASIAVTFIVSEKLSVMVSVVMSSAKPTSLAARWSSRYPLACMGTVTASAVFLFMSVRLLLVALGESVRKVLDLPVARPSFFCSSSKSTLRSWSVSTVESFTLATPPVSLRVDDGVDESCSWI